MSSIKENFIQLIDNLSENVTADEILYHIYIKSQILKGKQQIREGKGISQAEIEEEFAKWLK